MDIDKEAYPDALPLIEQKLRPGGLLIVDNLLWGGKVADEADQRPSTQAIRRLTDTIYKGERWDFVLCPLRDGFGVCRLRG
jgi:predicted O-methyltransferase YrrM